MSMFQMDAIADPHDDSVSANVFESLGMLREFRSGDASEFSYRGWSGGSERTRRRFETL